jgi:hypothetical protein
LAGCIVALYENTETQFPVVTGDCREVIPISEPLLALSVTIMVLLDTASRVLAKPPDMAALVAPNYVIVPTGHKKARQRVLTGPQQ